MSFVGPFPIPRMHEEVEDYGLLPPSLPPVYLPISVAPSLPSPELQQTEPAMIPPATRILLSSRHHSAVILLPRYLPV